MVLMSFSEPAHIPMLLDGRKQQTTRLPRKRPIKEGDVLHCYYKPRMKKGMCENCINQHCPHPIVNGHRLAPDIPCPDWNNFFGTATVTNVIPLKQALKNKETFAQKDGFVSWAAANSWFRYTSGVDKNWTSLPYVVIQFEPHWLKEGDLQ